MNDDLERLLSEAFDAGARAAVPAHTPVPAPRFESDEPQFEVGAGPRTRPARRRWIAPTIAAAAAIVVGAGVVAAAIGGDGGRPAATHATVIAKPVRAERGASNVQVSLFSRDGLTYGVGMPVIAYFSRMITDARSFQAATTATANGRPLTVAWYFETSQAGHGPIEAHLRPKSYWPADAHIHVTIDSGGITAGKGLGFADSLSLDFHTGPAQLASVNAQTHTLTLTSDGSTVGNYPVSLGKPATPTLNGVKVVMETQACLPSTTKCTLRDLERLTYGGEYLLAAPTARAVQDVRHHRDSSDGSTYLLPADAKLLYRLLRPGDVIVYPNSNGTSMTLGAGFGDWNVTWGQWLGGGLVPTH